jgi:hypothetical protein
MDKISLILENVDIISFVKDILNSCIGSTALIFSDLVTLIYFKIRKKQE